MTGSAVIPGQAEGLNPEPTIKRDACHPVVGSGFFAEVIIGPAEGRTRWLSPGMTELVSRLDNLFL